MKSELHIARFDVLDATAHSAVPIDGKTRDDSAERMRQVHAAAAHDKWFREQVAEGIKEADDPATQWVPHAVVKADMARQSAELKARIAKAK